jgi:hypothetical protein
MVESFVRGCEFSVQNTSQVGQITSWLEVSPLELKLAIEASMAQHLLAAQKSEEEQKKGKFDYEKENECCLCKCPLYDELKEKTIQQLISDQKKLRM